MTVRSANENHNVKTPVTIESITWFYNEKVTINLGFDHLNGICDYLR